MAPLQRTKASTVRRQLRLCRWEVYGYRLAAHRQTRIYTRPSEDEFLSLSLSSVATVSLLNNAIFFAEFTVLTTFICDIDMHMSLSYLLTISPSLADVNLQSNKWVHACTRGRESDRVPPHCNMMSVQKSTAVSLKFDVRETRSRCCLQRHPSNANDKSF